MKLANDLRALVCEIKEQEQLAELHNKDMCTGLKFARVMVETLLEQHGYDRPVDVRSESKSNGLVLEGPP
ncbi:hypothetical protein [Microbulbifer epialgicus]|uniref:Uncharacterized protein n=1 Tax=Microbulbifer epialgicus TaxID=393907 RepID=A0ABV4NTY9_9GAMM